MAAHASDVNVISWNRGTTYMLASGGDDGALRVWDLRTFAAGAPVANFAYHRWAGRGWRQGGWGAGARPLPSLHAALPLPR